VIARDDWGQAGEGEAAGLKRGGEWWGGGGRRRRGREEATIRIFAVAHYNPKAVPKHETRARGQLLRRKGRR
jgi:hypothetical protein